MVEKVKKNVTIPAETVVNSRSAIPNSLIFGNKNALCKYCKVVQSLLKLHVTDDNNANMDTLYQRLLSETFTLTFSLSNCAQNTLKIGPKCIPMYRLLVERVLSSVGKR